MVGIDETVERRGGRQIKATGCYRDAVRSSKQAVVKWISMMLLVPLPWSSRVWALPFLTVLAPAKRANEQAGRRHLGVETQRQWSDLAIARTTPVLLGLFSLVCLIAHRLTATLTRVPASSAWYRIMDGAARA